MNITSTLRTTSNHFYYSSFPEMTWNHRSWSPVPPMQILLTWQQCVTFHRLFFASIYWEAVIAWQSFCCCRLLPQLRPNFDSSGKWQISSEAAASWWWGFFSAHFIWGVFLQLKDKFSHNYTSADVRLPSHKIWGPSRRNRNVNRHLST